MYTNKNKLQTILNLVSWIIIIGLIVSIVLNWGEIPNKIPVHYSGWEKEDIDRFGDKSMLILPIIALLFVYIIILAISYFPGDFNFPDDIREKYGEIIRRRYKTMWCLIRVEYSLFVVYFVLRIINTQHLGYGMAIFVLVIGLTYGGFTFNLSSFRE